VTVFLLRHGHAISTSHQSGRAAHTLMGCTTRRTATAVQSMTVPFAVEKEKGECKATDREAIRAEA